MKLGEGGGLPSRDFSTESEQRHSRFSAVHPGSREHCRGGSHTYPGLGTEQTSQETEWSTFWKGCRESPSLTFLQHAQRLIGNRKTAALRATGP